MARTVIDYSPHSADGPRRRAATSAARRLGRVERLSWILDRSIQLGRWRIGLDPILGLLPGVGDWAGAALSCYVLYEGARLGVPRRVLMRMLGNILIEAVVGGIPVLGDLFDFAWQANTRNVALIRAHYRPGLEPRSLRWLAAAVLALALLLLLALATVLYAIVRAIATGFGG